MSHLMSRWSAMTALVLLTAALAAQTPEPPQTQPVPSSPEPLPMTTPEMKKRSAEIVRHLNASPAAVWKALSDSDELTRWFPLDARIKPGAGGSMFCSWRNEYQFDSPITIWEPQKHLRVLWGPADAPEAELFGVDFFIHAQEDGTTVLRLVHFGFGEGPFWDGMYDGVSRGWDFMLWNLDAYLTKHAGTPRQCVYLSRKVEGGDKHAAWARLFSKEGLFADPSIVRAKPGDSFRVRLTTGEEISGTVRRNDPGRDFQAMIDSLGGAPLRVQTDPCKEGEGDALAVTLSTYGLDAARFAAMEKTWHAAIERSAKVK